MENLGKPKRGKKRDRDCEFASWKNYMSTKVAKLQSQSSVDAKNAKSNIFKGIAIFVNGFTDPTADELKKIIIDQGGKYHHYYSRTQTTHIIATHLPNSKLSSRKTDVVVSPKWITESIDAGSLLDYKKFLLYSNHSATQPRLNFVQVEHKFEENKDIKTIDENKLMDTNSYSIEPEILHMVKLPDSGYQHVDSSEIKVVNKNNEISENLIVASYHDPLITLSTSNPNFIAEYYSNSRLHYLSTAGSMFKQYVKDLQSQEDNFKGRDDLKAWIESNHFKEERNFEKIVMHIDMDCFFVSVGLIKHPELKGFPVAVTHARNNKTIVNRNKDDFNYELSCIKERHKGDDSRVITANLLPKDHNIDGNVSLPENAVISTFDLIDGKSSMAEIASCSYEARQKGIKNGMLLGAALKLCPDLKTIPYDFEGYERVSKKLYDAVASYSKDIEAVSCDEMLVDLTQVLNECSVSPLNFATYLRNEIKLQTKCSCSIGLGPNMLVARLATYRAKPNGQHFVDSIDVAEFIKKQAVSNLPGVGGSLCGRLKSIGILTCEDLQLLTLEYLQKKFGSQTGKSLHDFCHGSDDRKINNGHKRKSVSAEINYGIRFQNFNDADKFVNDLSKEVSRRLTDLSLKGKTITLKLKVRAKNAPVETAKFMGHGICDSFSKSFTVQSFTSDPDVIYKVAMNLLKQISLKYEDLRGVGIQVSKLSEKKTCVSSSISSIKTFLKPKKNVLDVGKCVNDESLKLKNSLEARGVKKDNDPVKSDKYFHEPTNAADVATNIKAVEEKSSVNFIDLEVLSALPDELRQQVIDEYKSHGYEVPVSAENKSELKLQSKIDSENSKSLLKNNDDNELCKNDCTPLPQPGSSCLCSSPQPGPSWFCGMPLKKKHNNVLYNSALPKSEELEKYDNHKKKNSTQCVSECLITSFSQVDDSFLDALPADIKEDLKNDFAMQKNSKQKLGALHETEMRPHKLIENSVKQTKGHPVNSKKHVASPIKNKLIASKTEKICVNKDEINLTRERTNGINLNSPESCNVPNLCGEIEVHCVKKLIKKWILSCENPDYFDTEMLAAYCKELVLDKDLEKLELILKFIKRKTKLSTVSWQACYKNIINEVQKKMIETYKAKLFIGLS